jgi:hypothetical protein
MPEYEALISKRIDEPGYRWRMGGETGVLNDNDCRLLLKIIRATIQGFGSEPEADTDDASTEATPSFDFTITDADSETTYTPWTDGWAVGFKCERNGKVEYIYLNPSGGSDDGVPTVFAYVGTEGDSSQDQAAHHYDLFD